MTINDQAAQIALAILCLMKTFGWRKDDNGDDRKLLMKRLMTMTTSLGNLKRDDWSRGLSWKKVGVLNSNFGSVWVTVLSSVEEVAAVAAEEMIMTAMRKATMMTVCRFGKSGRSF